jgi:hypothetical protein
MICDRKPSRHRQEVFGDVSEATLSPFIVVIIPPAPPISLLTRALRTRVENGHEERPNAHEARRA